MKKIKFMTAALMACVMLSGCGGNNSSDGSDSNSTASAPEIKTIAERTEALLNDVEFPEMVEVLDSNLSAFYGIDAADVTEFSAYLNGAGAYPDQFGIFVATDADAAARIEERLNEYIEKQKSVFADYTPAEMYKFDDCFVSVNGNNVSFAVCADNQTAKDILG